MSINGLKNCSASISGKKQQYVKDRNILFEKSVAQD